MAKSVIVAVVGWAGFFLFFFFQAGLPGVVCVVLWWLEILLGGAA
jgi:hypothetical protein